MKTIQEHLKHMGFLTEHLLCAKARLEKAQAEFFEFACPPEISMHKVVESFANVNSMTAEDIMGVRRNTRIVKVRHEVWHYMHHQSGYIVADIAHMFGRHHATISHGIREHKRSLAQMDVEA